MKTGTIKDDQFTPYNMDKLKGLLPLMEAVNTALLQPKTDVIVPQHVIYFFMRYLAGGKNIKGQFAEIDLVEFMNHMAGDLSKESMIKAVARQTQLMVKAKKILSDCLTFDKLVGLNKLLNPSNKKGTRKSKLWVGNKKTNDCAFEASNFTKVRGLLDDFLLFLNDESVSVSNRLIIGTYQFAMIHPFMDGNGRTWRCLFWHMLSSQYDEAQALLIITYFKLINREGLYECCKKLREGVVNPYVNYWTECVEWSNKAHVMYHEIIKHSEQSKGVDISQVVELDYYLKQEKREIGH